MEIPQYPDTRPLQFSDKALFDGMFNLFQPQMSELTFANLYLFRKVHNYQLSMLNGSIVVLGRGYDGREYFLPPLGGDVAAALEKMLNDGLMLFGDEESIAGWLDSDGFVRVEDRDSFDYLYLRDEMATLPGNRFHKKKNRISYFTARHDYQSDLLTSGDVAECRKLLLAWHTSVNQIREKAVDFDFEACDEALVMLEELGLQGIVIRVEGVVSAFSLGEKLNDNTTVCHFEKADPYMEGLSQLVNREYAVKLFKDSTYINREQDLGEPGLRNAKLSYHPVRLINKIRVTAKQ